MAKLSLADIKNIRDEKRGNMVRRDTDKEVEIVIAMGTCGIAAGAKETFDAFVKELASSDIENAAIKQTGCMGFCAIEPTVEIRVPDMPNTIYNRVTPEVAQMIVKDHILGKKLVEEHIQDRPSVDIMADNN